jgi:arylsulfatase A-like enzyme
VNKEIGVVLRTTAIGVCMLLIWPLGAAAQSSTAHVPNIIYIYADDLGYGELGCYGQQRIRTPHLDALAASGLRFTQHYSGSGVCAPSRCVLLTGRHTGHAYIRANDEMKERGDVWHNPSIEGQRPLLPGTLTLASYLQSQGYRTACIGKWGLGGPGSTGHPNRQGFDLFFGYLCQRQAHNYYPTHLWRNADRVALDNVAIRVHQRLPEDADAADRSLYAPFQQDDYAVDHMTEEALDFVRGCQDTPFFLWLTYPIPHVASQVPQAALAEYQDAFEENPYRGDQGYCPHPTPRAAYAAMITLMDDHIGRLVRLLDELSLREHTLIMVSSDNGPTYAGGVDREFFHSAGSLRGHKGQLFEGGIRVPMIANWPGTIAAGGVTDHVSAQWDLFPTIVDLVAGDTEAPAELDGVSFWPLLTGEGNQAQHEFLYWEYGGQRAVRRGDWKALRRGLNKNPEAPIQLYDLTADPGEQSNLAAAHPGIVAELSGLMRRRSPAAFEKWEF